MSTCHQFFCATLRPFINACDHKDFQVSIWKHYRPDITAIHYNSTLLTDLPLFKNHRRTNFPDAAYFADGFRYIDNSNVVTNVFPI